MMKKIISMFIVAIMATMNVNAQDDVQLYFTKNQLPNLIKCLPAPPAFDSPEFANDMMRYVWGKQQRLNPERAKIAKGDAIWYPIDSLFHQFAVPFGLETSAEETPEIYKLLTTAIKTTDQMRVEPKAFYHRQRPFERFEDKMLTDEEDELRGEGSYPSGHTMRGWTCALLMAEIAPEQADTIFARGWMYGESRVIVGAHWQSDVDASRVAASIGYAALHGSAEFREQMAKAQQEYQAKKGTVVGVQSASIIEHPATRAYRVNGTPATSNSRGIIIENNQKVMRK